MREHIVHVFDEGHRNRAELADQIVLSLDGAVNEAAGDDPATALTGGYFHHRRPKKPGGAARNVDRQERLLAGCARLSGVELPPG